MFGKAEQTAAEKFHHGVLHIDAFCTFVLAVQRVGAAVS